MDEYDFPNEPEDGLPPKPKSGGWSCLGCLFALFAGGVVMVVLGVGLGYYVLFHTSFPLKQIEALLEEDPDFRVEGLKGSISSGFHVDELRFKDESGHWQELEQVDFEFNGLLNLISEQRLIIDHFTVGGGKLHVEPGDDVGPGRGDDRAGRGADGDDGPAGEGGGLKEVRIGLIQISNLVLVNEETGFECEIREISMRDFHYEDGRLRNLGDIVVDADHVELTVEPSDHFADAPDDAFARRIEGVVGAEMHEMVLADASFEIEILVAAEGETTVEARLWDGALLFDMFPDETQRVEFVEFDYEQLLKWDGGFVPSAVTGVLTTSEDAGGVQICEIEPGARFTLGQTKFAVESRRLEWDPADEVGPPIVAKSLADGEDADEPAVECRVHSIDDKPYVVVELVRGEERNTRSLFAETVFGRPFEELNAEQQARIDVSIEATGALEQVEAAAVGAEE